jgi:hypothetical protein
MKNQDGKEEQVNRICPCCGAKMTLHWHRLSKGLVQTLVKFKSKVLEKGENKVHISELEFNTTEFCNFQKLRYHAMIAKYKDKDGKRVGGYWLLTRRGSQFCKGNISVPDKVATFRNIIRKKSTELIYIGSVLKDAKLPQWDSISTMQFDNYDVFDISEELWDINGQGILTFKND